MSFTIKVKEELLGLGKKDKTELSAIIKISGSLGISSQGLHYLLRQKMQKLLVIFMNCWQLFIKSSRIFVIIKKRIFGKTVFILFF